MKQISADPIFVATQIPWIRIEDDLPRHAVLPPGGRLMI